MAKLVYGCKTPRYLVDNNVLNLIDACSMLAKPSICERYLCSSLSFRLPIPVTSGSTPSCTHTRTRTHTHTHIHDRESALVNAASKGWSDKRRPMHNDCLLVNRVAAQICRCEMLITVIRKGMDKEKGKENAIYRTCPLHSFCNGRQ
jgi:hypothetical protein